MAQVDFVDFGCVWRGGEVEDIVPHGDYIFLSTFWNTVKLKKRNIVIVGMFEPKSISYEIMFDRIEAGTYLIASALAGKKISILKVIYICKTKILFISFF